MAGWLITIVIVGVLAYRHWRVRRLLKRYRLLIKEQHHRVKNSLQLVTNLLSLQAAKVSGEKKELITSNEHRIRAITNLHQKINIGENLNEEVDIDDFLRELINNTVYITGRENIYTDVNISYGRMGILKATHLAILVNELLSNTIKHAEGSDEDHFIQVSFHLEANENGVCEMVYQDNNRHFNLDNFKKSSSIGRELIMMQLKYLSKYYELRDDDGCYVKLEMKA